MTDKETDMDMSPMQEARVVCQKELLLSAFLLGKKFARTKPIDIDRLEKIMGEFFDLEEKVGKIWTY